MKVYPPQPQSKKNDVLSAVAMLSKVRRMAADNLGLLVSDPHSVDIKATKYIGLSHRPIDSEEEEEEDFNWK